MRLGETIEGRPLTSAEVALFLARHPAAAARVAFHNSRGCSDPDFLWGVFEPGYQWEREAWGIPERGLYVEDSQLGGTAVIFPDAGCDLRYSVMANGPDPDTANAPNPDPVPHDRSIWDDVVTFGQGALVIAGLVYLVKDSGRRSRA